MLEFFEGVSDVVVFEDSVLCDFLDIVVTLFYLGKYEVVFVSDLFEFVSGHRFDGGEGDAKTNGADGGVLFLCFVHWF